MKRTAALLLCLLMLVQLTARPTQASETVYFTAVNENVLDLNSATMPFWSNGFLYVAGSIFSSKELGVYYSPNLAKQTVVLYTSSSELIFDLSTNTVKDGKGKSYSQPAIVRNGVAFVPIAMVADFFELTYTNTKVNHGYLVRVKSASAVMNDRIFIDAAGSQIEARYAQYKKSQSSTDVPSDSGQGEVSGKRVYLCFLASDAQQVSALLDALDSFRAQATFYVTAEFLNQNPDLLRRMAATGQGIGLAVQATQRQDPQQVLEASNRRLFDVICQKTRLVWLGGGGESTENRLRAEGYCPLQADLDRTAYGLSDSGAASTLLRRVSARSGPVSVWLADQAQGQGLRAFLSAAAGVEDRCLALTELES